MDGEFSRGLSGKTSGYTGVLLQQGRALVDAEWNEQSVLHNDQLRQAVADLIAKDRSELQPILKYDSAAEPASTTAKMLKVSVDKGIFYVAGVRCEQTDDKPKTFDLLRHPLDEGLAGPPAVSVHAWERTVSGVEVPELYDDALEGADSALRTKIMWELQADYGQVTRTPEGFYDHCGVIKTRHVGPDDHDAPPSLYRLEVIQDGVEKSVPLKTVARFAWAKENPVVRKLELESQEDFAWSKFLRECAGSVIELLTKAQLQAGQLGDFKSAAELSPKPAKTPEFYRLWDGVSEVENSPNNQYKPLDEYVHVLFDPARNIAAASPGWFPTEAQSWMKTKRKMPWVFPSGRHYFADFQPTIASPWARDGRVPHLAGSNNPELSRLIDRLVGSPDSQRRALPAKPLAEETTDVWLRKWLSTALFSEVAHGDFEQFWRRLSRSRPSAADDDGRLLNEAKRVWLKSQKVSLALNETALTNRLKSVI